MADCFNHSCPFRVNETSNANRCERTACPNICNSDFSIISNHTMTDKEIEEARSIYYGRVY